MTDEGVWTAMLTLFGVGLALVGYGFLMIRQRQRWSGSGWGGRVGGVSGEGIRARLAP